ncbi:MAG: DUF4126 domain-containing protein [Gammaproteobacteria bacterium]
MDPTASIALAAGAAWASGLNVYAVILILGVLGNTGYMTLPADLEIVMHPIVMIAAGFMYCVEFFADKTPGVDTAWDALHTFVRVPAGAMLAAGAVGEMEPALQMGAFLVGGGLAATSHTTKAATRVMLNTSPEPVTNWSASILEDIAVLGSLWAALNYPVLFLVVLVLVVAAMLWAIPRIWRGVVAVFRAVRKFFGARVDDGDADPSNNGVAPAPSLEGVNPKALGNSVKK